jgi:predicted XRE-type DNA-binding protein
MARNDPKPIPALTPEQIARFWSHVEIRGPNECWPWIGWIKRGRSGGYGLWTPTEDAGNFRTHRVAYYLAHGIDPGDDLICHRCDNRPCCNEQHLFAGTHRDNYEDGVHKGRVHLADPEVQALRVAASGDAHYSHRTPERLVRGEAHGNSNLTEAIVREIWRLRYQEGLQQKRIAANLGISCANVCLVVNAKAWRHITAALALAPRSLRSDPSRH